MLSEDLHIIYGTLTPTRCQDELKPIPAYGPRLKQPSMQSEQTGAQVEIR
jgi:hypothetical protein